MKNPMKSVECRRRYPCVVMSQISALRSRRLGTGMTTSRASIKLTHPPSLLRIERGCYVVCFSRAPMSMRFNCLMNCSCRWRGNAFVRPSAGISFVGSQLT